MSAPLPKQGVDSAPPWAPGKRAGAGGPGQAAPGQHDGRAVGEVAGPGAVAEALQREAKADEARADGEAELEPEAEQEVVLGLRNAGRPVTPGAAPPRPGAPQALWELGRPGGERILPTSGQPPRLRLREVLTEAPSLPQGSAPSAPTFLGKGPGPQGSTLLTFLGMD